MESEPDGIEIELKPPVPKPLLSWKAHPPRKRNGSGLAFTLLELLPDLLASCIPLLPTKKTA